MAGLGSWVLLYAALALALVALDTAVGTGFWIVRGRLDRAHPDDLPLSAGQLAAELAKRLNLGIDVLAAVSQKQGTDVFWMSGRTILLSTETYVKRDPTAWAIAAHEIGHAVTHGYSWILARIMESSRALYAAGRLVAAIALLGNLAFASPSLSTATQTALAIAIGALSVVLLDEAGASLIAMRLLREDGRLSEPQLSSARLVLLAAFSTYAAGLVGQVITLILVRTTLDPLALSRPFVPAAPLSGTDLQIASVLAALVALASVLGVLQAFGGQPAPKDLGEAQSRQQRAVLSDVARGVPVLLLVYWVWDQPYGPLWPFFVLAALTSARLAFGIAIYPALACFGILIAALLVPLIVGTGLLVTRYGQGETSPNAEYEQRKAAASSAGRLGEVALSVARTETLLPRLGRLLEALAPLPLAASVLWR